MVPTSYTFPWVGVIKRATYLSIKQDYPFTYSSSNPLHFKDLSPTSPLDSFLERE